MKNRHDKRLSDCIKCRDHIRQTSCAVICDFFKDSGRELTLTMCDDPTLDYIDECPRQLMNAENQKYKRDYFKYSSSNKITPPVSAEQSKGVLIKLFG